MKRFVVVILLAVVFSLVALYFISPEIVEKIWLWVVGLLGTIVAFFQRTTQWTGDKIKSLITKQSPIAEVGKSAVNLSFMQIYRYSRTGNHSQGLVFVEGQFVGISNENSSNPVGVYQLNIQQNGILLSNGISSSSFAISLNSNPSANDIVFSSDQNSMSNNSIQAFNAIFEQLSHWLEAEKQPTLQIFNPEFFRWGSPKN